MQTFGVKPRIKVSNLVLYVCCMIARRWAFSPKPHMCSHAAVTSFVSGSEMFLPPEVLKSNDHLIERVVGLRGPSPFPVVPIRPREDVQDLRTPFLAVLARPLGIGDCFQQASAVILFEPRVVHDHRHAIVSIRLGRLLVLQEGNQSISV